MYTVFEAGGEQYQLRFTVNALCEFEGKYNKGVIDALSDSKNFYYLRGLFWAGLLTMQKSITVDKAGEIIDGYLSEDHEYSDLVELLTEALKGAGFFRTSGNAKIAETKATAKGKK